MSGTALHYDLLAEQKDKSNQKIARPPEPNTKEVVKELSLKYSIPENKLAGMIIDFEIWEACERERD